MAKGLRSKQKRAARRRKRAEGLWRKDEDERLQRLAALQAATADGPDHVGTAQRQPPPEEKEEPAAAAGAAAEGNGGSASFADGGGAAAPAATAMEVDEGAVAGSAAADEELAVGNALGPSTKSNKKVVKKQKPKSNVFPNMQKRKKGLANRKGKRKDPTMIAA